jgi:hypothetical protein
MSSPVCSVPFGVPAPLAGLITSSKPYSPVSTLLSVRLLRRSEKYTE